MAYRPVNKPIVITYKNLQAAWVLHGLCKYCGRKPDVAHSPKLCKRMRRHQRK